MKRIHTRTYRQTAVHRETRSEGSTRWWVPVLASTVCALFIMAVLAAGVSIRASYTLANLQDRREAALHEQQILREELAEVTSLAHTKQHAEELGFTSSVAPVATLDVAVPVAQR